MLRAKETRKKFNKDDKVCLTKDIRDEDGSKHWADDNETWTVVMDAGDKVRIYYKGSCACSNKYANVSPEDIALKI